MPRRVNSYLNQAIQFAVAILISRTVTEICQCIWTQCKFNIQNSRTSCPVMAPVLFEPHRAVYAIFSVCELWIFIMAFLHSIVIISAYAKKCKTFNAHWAHHLSVQRERWWYFWEATSGKRVFRRAYPPPWYKERGRSFPHTVCKWSTTFFIGRLIFPYVTCALRARLSTTSCLKPLSNDQWTD